MTHGSEKHIVIGEHFYQPPRKGSHHRLVGIKTDPNGVNWNSVVSRESYIPQIKRGILKLASFDFYSTLRIEMEKIAPNEAGKLEKALKERGVGDPFLHVLLPDLSYEDKYILIEAGKQFFEKQTGEEPLWFWAPETALDLETLEVLNECGYIGVICAPEQVEAHGREVDNHPVRIDLANGEEILLLAFDRPVSTSFAFDKKTNADEFVYQSIIPRLDRLSNHLPMVTWTDGETFGHHAAFADQFLAYLLKTSLPTAGVAVLGINELVDIWDEDDYIDGSLRERSAWSCPHGDLVRWHGACPCDNGFHGGWKTAFMGAVMDFNEAISSFLEDIFDGDFVDELAKNFKDIFEYNGHGKDRQMSLLAAKASSLASMTSCGTFFDSPGTSGRINMLFIRQALEHLVDAGFRNQAENLLDKLIKTLSTATDPHQNMTLDKVFADILVLSV